MIFLLCFFMMAVTIGAVRLIRQKLKKELLVLAGLSSIFVALILLIVFGVDLPYIGTAMNNFFQKIFPFFYKL